MTSTQGIRVSFNDYDLSDILMVKVLRRGVRLGRKSNLTNRKNKKGVDFLGYSSNLIAFEMEFIFKVENKDGRDKLKEILDVSEPKPLIFSDEPDKVYYAFPQEDIDVSEASVFAGGTIVWEIPEGVSYSRQDHIFSNKDTEGKPLDMFIIENPGTESIELEMTALFPYDNGFLGIESDPGEVRALFGTMEEIDGYDYQISEKLFDDHLFEDKGWVLNDGVVPPVTGKETQQGRFTYKEESENEGFAYPSVLGEPTDSWSGPSLTKIVPPDSNGEYPENWSSDFRVDFNTDGAGQLRASQVGHQSITFSDQNGHIIVSIVIEDNTPTAQKSDLAIYIRNKRVYDSRNTSSYYVTARPGESNHIHVEKMGNKINVELAFIGRKLSFDFPEPGSELRKVTFYAARYKTLNPMQNNLIRALNVVKHNVDKWQNIPNKFMPGDVLVYGKNKRNIYCRLNEMNALEMRDVGSTLIQAPPGISRMYLAYSSFADTPEVTLRGRARYAI